MTSIDIALSRLGFQPKLVAQDPSAISRHFLEHARKGLYVLHLSDQTFYVGQTIDIIQRYTAHRTTYNDIEYISFKPIEKPIAELLKEERQAIYTLEAKGVRLLNVIHTSISYSSSLFDLVMPLSEQKEWLEQGSSSVNETTHPRLAEDSNQRIRTERKVAQMQKVQGHNHLVHALQLYVTNCIPAYRRSERDYWAMSLLPSTGAGERFSAISLSNMETFVIFKDGASFINLAISEFQPAYPTNKSFTKVYPQAYSEYSGYQAGGIDQVRIRMDDAKTTLQVLKDSVIQRGARLMNLNLMRQRTSLYARYHSYQLADMII